MNIDSERLKKLEDAEAKLNALEAGGVDNWQWYGESLKDYFKLKEAEEAVDDLITELCEAISSEIDEPAGSGCGYGIKEDGLNEMSRLIRTFLRENQND